MFHARKVVPEEAASQLSLYSGKLRSFSDFHLKTDCFVYGTHIPQDFQRLHQHHQVMKIMKIEIKYTVMKQLSLSRGDDFSAAVIKTIQPIQR